MATQKDKALEPPSNSERIRARVVAVLSEQLGVGEDECTNDSLLIDDLGADSLDVVEIVMGLEEEFGIDIPDDDGDALRTVADVVACCERRIVACGRARG